MAAVADIILAQLGGNRFITMTGAKNFVGDINRLSFQLPGNARCDNKRVDGMWITLASDDTYTLTAIQINRKNRTHDIVESRPGIYVDNLQQTFTALTGLRTSL